MVGSGAVAPASSIDCRQAGLLAARSALGASVVIVVEVGLCGRGGLFEADVLNEVEQKTIYKFFG